MSDEGLPSAGGGGSGGDGADGGAAAVPDDEEVDGGAVLDVMNAAPSSALSRGIESVRDIAGVGKKDIAGGVERAAELEMAGARWYILHPQALGLKLWDGLQAIIVTYLFFQLPVLIAFTNTALQLEKEGLLLDGEEPPTAHSQSDYIVDAVLFADLLSRTVRAHYDVDYYGVRRLIVAPRDILLFWVKTTFIRDSLSCLPIDTGIRLLGHPQTASWVRCLRLLRMESVLSVKGKVDTMLDEAVGSSWLRPLVSAFSLLLMMMFFNHVLACILYWLGHPVWDETKSVEAVQWAAEHPEMDARQFCHTKESGRCGWVQAEGYIADTPDYVKYADAFYYSFTILTTVGFGDISAHSFLERLSAILAMTMGCAVFGIVMGQITAVLHGLHVGQARYDEKIRELEQYMEYRGLSHALRERAKRFYIRKFPTKRLYDEKQILMGLPLGLRTEFLLDMNKSHIQKLPFIPLHDHAVMIAVCRALKQETFMPGEIIAREGAVGRYCYLVMSGMVSVRVRKFQESALGARGLQVLAGDKRHHKPHLHMPHLHHASKSELVDDEADADLWQPAANLIDGHYFGEQALFYEAPRNKRYVSMHMSTVGSLEKDDMDAIQEDYPNMTRAVRTFALHKLEKLQSRLKSHHKKTKILHGAALRETTEDADRIKKYIGSWGEGEIELMQAANAEELKSQDGPAGLSAMKKTMRMMQVHVGLGDVKLDGFHNLGNPEAVAELAQEQQAQTEHELFSGIKKKGGMFARKLFSNKAEVALAKAAAAEDAEHEPDRGLSLADGLQGIVQQLETMEREQESMGDLLKELFADRTKIESMRRDLRDMTDPMGQ